MHNTVVDARTLVSHLGDSDWVVLDCRFDLTQPEAGRERYLAGHVPGAVYAHLNEDLSGPPLTHRGRHPVPLPEALRRTFGRWGVTAGRQVVVYDDAGGSIAARAWWLLRYMGHDAVAVLDGGWQAWLEAGGALERQDVTPTPAQFRGEPRQEWLVGIADVEAAPLLVDARDPPRYRGELEPFDPQAGHIPGARNRCWRANLGATGRFLTPEVLRAAFLELLGAVTPSALVSYCGSGVTGCHNLLAMAHAGLPVGRLYGGSWSEWSSTPGRPVATGEEP